MQTEKQKLVADLKTFMIDELRLHRQPSDIKDDAKLFGPDGLGIDSLDGLQLGIAAEERFKVKIPVDGEGESHPLSSVSALADYILAQKK